jgi:surfeit locus 1 family protein
MTSSSRRFPLGLTLAAAVVFAVCAGLGVWQLQRAAWKAGQLQRIAALQAAPPVPIALALTAGSDRIDTSQKRVAAACQPDRAAPAVPKMTTDAGEWITRAISFCRLSGAAYEGVWVDRGFVQASRGSTTPAQVILPAPVNVVGVLSHISGDCFGSDGCAYWFANLIRPAPYVLVAERETPPAPGVTPAPYANAAGNLQYVGEYAPTWFGLAGVAACFYAAMLWRRYRP